MTSDIFNLVYNKKGIDEEYSKIKNNEKILIEINGNTNEAIEQRGLRLANRRIDLFERIQEMIFETVLTERALIEIQVELGFRKRG